MNPYCEIFWAMILCIVVHGTSVLEEQNTIPLYGTGNCPSIKVHNLTIEMIVICLLTTVRNSDLKTDSNNSNNKGIGV